MPTGRKKHRRKRRGSGIPGTVFPGQRKHPNLMSRSGLDLDQAKSIESQFKRDHNVQIKEIKKLEHLKMKYDLWKIEGYDGSEWFMAADYDNLNEHAKHTVETVVGEYIDAGHLKEGTDEEIEELVKLYGEADFLAKVDGMIYETNDGKPYYRYN